MYVKHNGKTFWWACYFFVPSQAEFVFKIYVVAYNTVVAAVGARLCQLACVVLVALGMGMEDAGDRLYGWVFPAVASLHDARYRPYAYALGCWRL